MNNAMNALVFFTLVGLACTTAAPPPLTALLGVDPSTVTVTPAPISFTQPPELQGGEPDRFGAVAFYGKAFGAFQPNRQDAWEEAMESEVANNPLARTALDVILIDILEVTDEFTPSPFRPPIDELLAVAKNYRSLVYPLLLQEFGFSQLPESLVPFYPRPPGYENRPVPFLEKGSFEPVDPSKRFGPNVPRQGSGVVDHFARQPI